ncbi:response regulator receiver (plasmid) [Gemmatirosa kalamazoonensis]|uniref:Response regulator receiver n=1 Tax=Gemmatirosa kalamazoonensis TaxID=861299 RepID=W0RSK8_9BACT|nr:response regulator transcription factor [Gemmatirosa kalamazoonensis]AHG92573.1 response regulator receiver [Gemmatirosa kalamazoonensis]
MTRTTHTPMLPPGSDLEALGLTLAARPYVRRGVAMRDEPIRVVIVDDHAVVRAGIRALLAGVPDVVVVGEGADGRDAVALVERLGPEVVIMDLEMPGVDGTTATRALHALPVPPKVLVLTMHTEEERLLPLLDAGASGYLAKDAAERDLVDAIRVVASGDVYVRPRVARMLAESVRHGPAPDARRAAFDSLSAREQTVLRLVAEGYNGPEIGQQLGISAKTVDTYKQRVEEKVGLAHRTDYVRFALDIDLIRK